MVFNKIGVFLEEFIESELQPAFNDFKLSITPPKQVGDLDDIRLQLCHRIVTKGLYFSCAGHLTNRFNKICQLKMIQTAILFLDNFFDQHIRVKESVKNKYRELKSGEEKAQREEAAKAAEEEKDDAGLRGSKNINNILD